ncbi:MAG: hypothetical protein IT284_01505 [Bacteroidetes bacterium]|nr:hypothetical protein [Bacteroidota bacterium]
MKTFLKIIAIIAVVIILLSVAGYYFVVKPGISMYTEGKTYSQNVVNVVTNSWNVSDLKTYGSQELITSLDKDSKSINLVFDKFKKNLGKLKTPPDLQGKISAFKTLNKTTITLALSGEAVFEKGSGEVKITVIKTDEGWKVLYFGVFSPLLI